MGVEEKIRCFGTGDELYEKYHDEEWGVPVYDDKTLFEFLVLEGAQAGLSWITILKRREGYKEAFYKYDLEKIVNMSDEDLDRLREDEKIIRNKLKIYSVRKNARVFVDIQKEFGSFSKYLWEFVNGKPIKNNYKTINDVPAKTSLSDKISKDLKRRGMNFVGSTIIYAYMQAVGLVNDHSMECWCYKK